MQYSTLTNNVLRTKNNNSLLFFAITLQLYLLKNLTNYNLNNKTKTTRDIPIQIIILVNFFHIFSLCYFRKIAENFQKILK